MVFDETVDLVDTLRRIAQFFRDESCGQCVPCRVGSVRQEELLARLAAGSERAFARRGARPAARHRPGHARCLDLRPGPDGVVGDRVGAAAAGAGGAVSEDTRGLSMSRDPRPIRTRHMAGRRQRRSRSPRSSSARPLGRPDRRRLRPSRRRRRRADDRRRGRGGPGGHDDPRRVPPAGHRHADPVLRREPDAGQRLSRVRRRGHGLARARARLLAQGRGRDGRADRFGAGPPVAQGRAGVPGLVGRRVAGRAGRARRRRSTATWSATARTRPATDRRPPAPPPGSATTATPGHHHAAAGDATAADRRPADEDRQRPVRPRLLEVHPLLQVRRGVRRGRPEHVRDRGRRTRVRRPDLDRAGRPAARSRPASTAATASASARRAR